MINLRAHIGFITSFKLIALYQFTYCIPMITFNVAIFLRFETFKDLF